MSNQNVSKSRTSSAKEPRARKKKRRAFKVLAFVFILTLIIGGGYLLLNHPTFNIESFNISGTQKYSVDEIVQKMGLSKNKNIFLQILNCDRKKVTELPYVEEVKFSIKLPNKVNIKVIERISKYFAFDKEKNKYFRLDEKGHILEEATIDKKTSDELLVIGITFDDDVVLGEKINEIDMSKINIFLDIKEELEKSKINRNITKVNFENSLTTLTLNDKLNVIFPNKDELSYKMAFLNEILKSIGEEATGELDLTQTNPTYSSVKKE